MPACRTPMAWPGRREWACQSAPLGILGLTPARRGTPTKWRDMLSSMMSPSSPQDIVPMPRRQRTDPLRLLPFVEEDMKCLSRLPPRRWRCSHVSWPTRRSKPAYRLKEMEESILGGILLVTRILWLCLCVFPLARAYTHVLHTPSPNLRSEHWTGRCLINLSLPVPSRHENARLLPLLRLFLLFLLGTNARFCQLKNRRENRKESRSLWREFDGHFHSHLNPTPRPSSLAVFSSLHSLQASEGQGGGVWDRWSPSFRRGSN